MSWRAMCGAVVAMVAGWGVASAQVVDSAAAAVGIYRAIVPSDTARRPAPAGDSLRKGTPNSSGVRDSLTDTTRLGAAAGPLARPGCSLGRVDSLGRPDSLGRVDSLARVDSLRQVDSLARVDSSVTDTSRKKNALQPVDEPGDGDTSLTARMDARRGGGLHRAEFPDLLSTAAMTGGYRTFLKLVGQSTVRRMLADTTPVTLLAPTDSAFARLPESDLVRLRTDPKLRDAWLGTLVFNGSLKSRDLVKARELRSRGGTVVRFSQSNGVVRAGPARLVQPDLLARNGVLQGVDRVVLPDATSAFP